MPTDMATRLLEHGADANTRDAESCTVLMIAASKGDVDTVNVLLIEIIEKYGETVGEKSFLGWDYARYVSLCG
jgi:ankyrin repeat protein